MTHISVLDGFAEADDGGLVTSSDTQVGQNSVKDFRRVAA